MSKTDQRPTYEALERQLANLKKENATLHRTQRRLAEVGSFAASVIDQVADGLCVWHEMDRYPYVWVSVWNEKMVEITGYTKQDVNRDGWYQTIFRDTDVAVRAKDRMDRIWNGEDLESEEWEVTRKDGSKRLIHISMSLIEGKGDVPYVLACMHDVSESKEAIRRARDHLEVQVRERTAELNNRREQLETANRRLYRENAKRRRLSEKLVDLIESERNEICMSLHENMAQCMAILGIQLDYIQGRIGNGPDDLVHMVEKAKVLVGTVIDDMKRLSQGIGSDVLTHLGLVPALRSLMQQLDAEKGGKIRKELSVSAVVENRLNSRKRLALFRIAQEALTNIKKHAEATRVRLDLVGGEHDIRLMIEDDGSGFDPEAVKTVSHGLLIMEERSEQCGGELFVESDERRGTSVMAKIPVDGDRTEPSVSPSYVSKMVTKGR
jgi:PAS domain S-box-containing protein